MRLSKSFDQVEKNLLLRFAVNISVLHENENEVTNIQKRAFIQSSWLAKDLPEYCNYLHLVLFANIWNCLDEGRK